MVGALETSAAPPLTRWSSTWRYLVALGIALLLLAIVATDLYAEPRSVTEDRALLLLVLDAVIGLGLALPAMRLRRRWPVAVAVAVTLMTGVSGSAGGAWLVVVVSLASRRRWREVVPVGLLSVAMTFVYRAVNPTGDANVPWYVEVAGGLLLFGVTMMVGYYVGARRELRASRLDAAAREQGLMLAQAREQERTRIAREMHDVLAHRISLVALHAGALAYREDLSREQTRSTAATIRDGAHQALGELRDVLGVLRDPTALGDSAPDPPQPTLGDLPALVAEAVDIGMHVELRDTLTRNGVLPDVTGRTVFRTVQESLTNARKHSPGMPVTVAVTGRPGSGVVVEVRNPISRRAEPADGVREADDARRPSVPGAGVGLTGLAERAALAGGRLEHGVTSEGDFRVVARLPWPQGRP